MCCVLDFVGQVEYPIRRFLRTQLTTLSDEEEFALSLEVEPRRKK